MTGRYCPECGTPHASSVDRCPRCGVDLHRVIDLTGPVAAGVGGPMATQAGGRLSPGSPGSPVGGQAPAWPAGAPNGLVSPDPTIPTAPAEGAGGQVLPFGTTVPADLGRPTTTDQPGRAHQIGVWIVAGTACFVALVLAGLYLFQDSADQEPTPPAATSAAASEAPAPEVPQPTLEATAPEVGQLVPVAPEEDKPSPATPPSRPATGHVAAAAAGVDFSWLTLPEGATAADYEWVTDDTGTLTVQVPTGWSDRDLRQADVDGVAAPSIWAATSLEHMMQGGDSAGLTLELWTGAPASGTLEEVLTSIADAANTDDACRETRTYPYDDGWYIGTAYLHAGCGTAGAALLQVVAAEGIGRMLPLQVQMISTGDVEAAVRAIETFQVVGVAAPAPAAPPAVTVPVPVPAAPTTIFGLPTGLFCRDLDARGYGYADAVEYWWAEGSPDRMDADRNGIPCETVYPAWQIDDYWGFNVPAAPVDESAEALAVVEDALYACGYSLALSSYVDGPFPDGGYAVTMTVDVGWTLVDAQFEVFPWSGEVYGFDADADSILACGW